MNAVGIDVSKGKSMVAALRPMGEIALSPKEYPHTRIGFEQLAYDVIALGEDTRVIMEATGRYHEPVASALHEYGIFVTVLNPLFIKQSGGGSIRKVKTDKADAIHKAAHDDGLAYLTCLGFCRADLRLKALEYCYQLLSVSFYMVHNTINVYAYLRFWESLISSFCLFFCIQKQTFAICKSLIVFSIIYG